jgi:multisubunit Na+/H+ antiporter MnhG subunit
MTEDGGDRPQSLREWFGRVADTARDLVRDRIEEAAKQAAQILDEEFSHALADAERRLRRLAIYAGMLAVGVALIAVGLAGAVGEWLGRPWLGELVVGAVLIVTAVVWLSLVSRAAKRRAAEEAQRAAADGAARKAAEPSIAAAGTAGWLAGLILSQRRGRREN